MADKGSDVLRSAESSNGTGESGQQQQQQQQHQQPRSTARNRVSNKSQSWEGTTQATPPQPPPPPPAGSQRRRSSILSDFSLDDTRRSLRSSTDNLVNPASVKADMEKLAQEESTPWHSAPLAFAILPAVGGLFFNNGSAVVTDVLLLGLATVVLNWCVRLPWDWYRSAQLPAGSPSVSMTDTIFEEAESEYDEASETPVDQEQSTERLPGAFCTGSLDYEADHVTRSDLSPQYKAAIRELRQDELMALTACFLGPIVGAYLLHSIRDSLSRPSEGLVSNYNLTIFLLAAEIRPVSHLIRMLQARTLYLQKVVRDENLDPDVPKPSSDSNATTQDLNKRVAELETHLADIAVTNTSIKEGKTGSGNSTKNTSSSEVVGQVRQSFQPQLDALNRAVRRYEKRATTQTMVTEARLQDLEARLKDALSLAAAAAQYKQKQPSFALLLLDWISSLFMVPLQAAWALFVYPLNLAFGVVLTAKVWLFGSSKRVRPKGRGKGVGGAANGHGSLNGYRAQQAAALGMGGKGR